VQVIYGLDLIEIDLYSLMSDHVSKKLALIDTKGAFRGIKMQLMLLKSQEHAS